MTAHDSTVICAVIGLNTINHWGIGRKKSENDSMTALCGVAIYFFGGLVR